MTRLAEDEYARPGKDNWLPTLKKARMIYYKEALDGKHPHQIKSTLLCKFHCIPACHFDEFWKAVISLQ
jgi:hypothetical protein